MAMSESGVSALTDMASARGRSEEEDGKEGWKSSRIHLALKLLAAMS